MSDSIGLPPLPRTDKNILIPPEWTKVAGGVEWSGYSELAMVEYAQSAHDQALEQAAALAESEAYGRRDGLADAIRALKGKK